MREGSSEPWKNLFVGRDDELSELVRLFHIVAPSLLQSKAANAPSPQPQMVVLVADSGYGKSRLVQRFYTELSGDKRFDPEGYWPDDFGDADKAGLNVNPAFGGEGNGLQGKRPRFIWWGLRWRPPDERNPQILCSGMDAYEEVLRVHHYAIVSFRQEAAVTVIKVGGKLIGDLIPGVKIVRKLYETFTKLKGLKKGYERSRLDVGKSLAIEPNKIAKDVLEFFRAAFRPWCPGQRPIPVVIWLDDAHWMDAVSIEFIHRLWTDAQKNRWPLMVVATYWEEEWRRHSAMNGGRSEAEALPSRLFAQLPMFDKLREQDLCWGKWLTGREGTWLLALDPVPDLDIVVREALPGLTTNQRAFLVERAAGNPQVLRSIIEHCRRQRRWFRDNDPSQPLRDECADVLNGIPAELERLAERKLDTQTEAVRSVLGIASIQGKRFLRRVVEEVARRSSAVGGDPSGDVGDCLTEAMHPGTIIQTVNASGLYEFRLSIYHEKARDYLSPHERHRALELTRTVLADLFGGDDLNDFSLEEQADLVEVALVLLNPRGTDGLAAPPAQEDATWQAWVRAIQRGLILAGSGWFRSRAKELASAYSEAARISGGAIPLHILAFRMQHDVAQILVRMGELGAAETIYRALEADVRKGIVGQSPFDNQRNVFLMIGALADITRRKGDVIETKRLYGEAIEFGERLVVEYPATPETLRDLSNVYDRLADLAREQNDASGAECYFRKGMENAEKIIRDYPETPEGLVNFAVSLGNLSDMVRTPGDVMAISDLYSRGKEIANRILKRLPEEATARAQVSRSLRKLGEVAVEQQDNTEAERLFRAALTLAEQNAARNSGHPAYYGELVRALDQTARLLETDGERRYEIAELRVREFRARAQWLSLALGEERLYEEAGVAARNLEKMCEKLDAGGKARIAHEAVAILDRLLLELASPPGWIAEMLSRFSRMSSETDG